MKHICIISPSGAIEPNLVFLSQQRLEAWGFRVSIAPHALGKNGRFSATPQQRLSDLNAALADPTVDIILCSRGGYGLQQIADRIVLPTRPKDQWPLIVGFSDITVLHALMSLHGVPSLHASMCKALATLPDHAPALQALREALNGGLQQARPDLPQLPADTPIIGGNLSVLYGLQGTPYSLNAIIDQCHQPPVLLIEDICERHYHIDRMMNNLRLSGVLSRISGVILGQFTDCQDDPAMGETLHQTLLRLLSEYHIPVITDATYGHVDDNMPIRLS